MHPLCYYLPLVLLPGGTEIQRRAIKRGNLSCRDEKRIDRSGAGCIDLDLVAKDALGRVTCKVEERKEMINKNDLFILI